MSPLTCVVSLAARVQHHLAFPLYLAAFCTGCGGSAPPALEAPTPEASEEQAAETSASLEAPAPEKAKPEVDTWEEGDDQAAASEGDSASGHEPREVLYRVSQRGLKVQIEGSEFLPKVEAVKVNGRWGVRLTVTATTEAERALLSPDRGPLAFGGRVKRGTVESFGDRRSGDDVLLLTPEDPVTFARTWPGAGEKGLLPGESLELQVGLWGLGPDAETLGPIRRFVVVKMTADQQGAQPIVQPPAN